MMIFRKGELFSGPGGLALGAKLARVLDENGQEVLDSQGIPYRVEHVWANDYDPSSCKTYIRNICPDKPESVYICPVQQLDIKNLPPIDALIFGFPCNDFSIVGEHKGMYGEYGPLYSYGVEVLRHHQPMWFIAENVGGLQSANEGKAFIRILDELADAGYKLTPHLYKFEEYGVPQTRHRIIIVGIRKDLDVEFKIPAPTHKNNYVTAYEAIMHPPIPDDAPNNEKTKHKNKVVEMLRYIPPGENAWYEGIPEHLRLNVKKARLSQIYRRLRPDQPAYTITGSGGGGTHVYHWEEPRALTNRERARLQTFPDDFIFEGTKEEVRKQIGMAVPPLGAKIIVEAVLKSFAGIDYDYVEPKWDCDLLLQKQISQLELELEFV